MTKVFEDEAPICETADTRRLIEGAEPEMTAPRWIDAAFTWLLWLAGIGVAIGALGAVCRVAHDIFMMGWNLF